MVDIPVTGLGHFLAKIERRGTVSVEARKAFLAIPTMRRTLSQYQDIVREGDRPVRSCMVETGLVSRYKTLRNGSRQILSFHIPGDMIDLQSALIVVADHGIRTHMSTDIVSIAHADILDIAADFPDVGRAFWFDTLIDASIFREWTVNVGRRNARARTAHLLLEIATKYRIAGITEGNIFPLPISQNDLSDALGMTSVHLNRTLQWMKGERYIRTHAKTMEIENLPAMMELAGFDPMYLHPEGPRVLQRPI